MIDRNILFFFSKLKAMNFVAITCMSIILSSCVGDPVQNIKERERLEALKITAPTISSVSPSFSSLAGGGVLTLIGTKFSRVTTLTVGGSTCPIITQTDAIITCTLPAGSAGSATITATNDVLESNSLTGSFNYLGAPTVTSVSSSIGSSSGLDLVTITGTGFYSITDITFDGSSCTGIVQISDTQATCTTPAHTAGSVNVVVTNIDTQFGTGTGVYTYEDPPTISSFAPATLFQVGSESLVITGTGFLAGATVSIDGNLCTPLSVDSLTQITCTTPVGSGSSLNVVVTNTTSGLTATSTIDYIPAPIIYSMDREKGRLSGGELITFTGLNLVGGGSFGITIAGGVTCNSPTVISPTQATCITVANAAASGAVVLTNNDGQTVTYGAFEYRLAPSVVSVLATTGILAGGETVTITGTDFDLTAASVTIGGNPCTSVSITNSTTITCLTPSNTAGTYDIIVTNTDDNQFGTGSSLFTYNPAPTISSLSLGYGSLAGGEVISINGTNFLTGALAYINNVPCSVSTVMSTTQINCTVPGPGLGLTDVKVVNLDLQQFIKSSSYTYRAPPTITGISPIAGPLAGGQTVTLTGTGFMSGLDILINGTSCTSINRINATTATCVTNVEVAGSYAVTATNLDAQTVTQAGFYEYIPAPTVTSISPAFGDVAGGTTVTVTGTGFHSSGQTATIDGVACTSPAYVNGTTFTCVTGAHITATALTMIATNTVDGQVSPAAGSFDYKGPPVLTEFQISGGGTVIDGGSTAGLNTVRLVGTDFESGMVVNIGSATCTDGGNMTVTPPTIAECTIPGAVYTAQAEDVILTNLDTQTTTSSGAYIFRPEPTITSYDYAYGAAAGGNIIVITGTDFVSGANANVTIGGANCASFSFDSATQITCTTPAGTLGARDVVITNNDTQVSTTGTGDYSYVIAPTVTTFSPTSIFEVGAQTLTVNGTGFYINATITVNGSPCAVTDAYASVPTSIQCTTPAGTGTGINVVVTNEDSQSATGTINYIPVPTITSYDYAFGPVGGANTIVLTGTNFVTGLGITIGGAACTGGGYISATSANCVVPTGSLGAVDVVLTNPDTQSVTDAGAFEYIVAPAITTFSPTTIYEVGSQTLTINGSGFKTGALVTVNAVTCTVLTVSSAVITCTTPASTGTAVAVVVTNLDGQVNGAATIDYIPAPTVTAVTGPAFANEGMAIGSELITIDGTNFLDTTPPTVTINSVACTPVTWVNATQITCTSGAGTGSGNVIVTNKDGQAVTYGTPFTYYPAPTLTSITPTGGNPVGGTAITITGTGFRDTGSFAINIAGVPCTANAVTNSTTATCTVDAGALGAQDVNFINKDGQTASLPGAFTYSAAPTIATIAPAANGPATVSQTITINGTNFAATSVVNIDGSACTNFNFLSTTQVQCDTPIHAAGAVNLVVTNIDSQTATILYTFNPAPAITALASTGSAANEAYADGSGSLTLTGTNFVSGATITVGGVACPVTDAYGAIPTSIVCNLAAGVGSQNVIITNPDSQSHTFGTQLTYINAPTVSSLSISYGQDIGTDAITITGNDFRAGATVTIGGVSCTALTVTPPTTISCTTGAHAAGIVDVIVTNTTYDGQSGTLPTSFTYVGVPTIGSVLPANGALAGGTTITLTGTNYIAGATVTVDGSSCTSLNVVNSSSITCVTPVGSAGAKDVAITNPAQPVVTSVGAYTYLAGAPTVASISPQGGDITGGTPVTITGTNFDIAMTDGAVVIGGVNCTGVSATTTVITCSTGARAQGLIDVVVTNPDTQTVTLATSFLYAPGATISGVSPAIGDTGGGTTVTITGTGFVSGMVSVDIGGVACGGVAFNSATEITCVTGANAAGIYNVDITQYYQTQSLATSFTYVDGAILTWQVGAVSPNPPNPADYGSVNVNSTFTFTLANTGAATSSTISLARTGANAGSWILGTDNCSGTTLASGNSCTVQVTFLAGFLGLGSYTATLEATAVSGGTTTNDLQGTVIP
jgi:hypothetical protein